MYFEWKPYVPAAQRRKKAQRAIARVRKNGEALSPIIASRGAIAKTFWGKAWCENLERYSDFSNRLPRGRTYLRNGSVIDLSIAAGQVSAQVMGSRLYKVAVKVSAVPKNRWQAISADCAGSIDSVVELLQGRLSKSVMERICRPQTGLFPAAEEISFSCSCPDWAEMCKHVAAVFYGIGARLDEQPELLFLLRRVDAKDLVMRAGAGLAPAKKNPAARKMLDDSMIAEVFGIEMDEAAILARRTETSTAKKQLRGAGKRALKRKNRAAANSGARSRLKRTKKATVA